MTWDGAIEMEAAPPAADTRVTDQLARDVISCRKRRSSEIIRNFSSENAKIIMENLIELAINAKLDVRLITGVLANNTYDSLATHFERALGAVNRVKIIILDKMNADLENNNTYKMVRKHPNGRILCLSENAGSYPHFMLIGSVAYRIEVDDRTKEAYACFDDVDGLVVGHYTRMFREKWNGSIQGEDNGNNGPLRTD